MGRGGSKAEKLTGRVQKSEETGLWPELFYRWTIGLNHTSTVGYFLIHSQTHSSLPSASTAIINSPSLDSVSLSLASGNHHHHRLLPYLPIATTPVTTIEIVEHHGQPLRIKIDHQPSPIEIGHRLLGWAGDMEPMIPVKSLRWQRTPNKLHNFHQITFWLRLFQSFQMLMWHWTIPSNLIQNEVQWVSMRLGLAQLKTSYELTVW